MTINCNGDLISFDSLKVMGILNLTPDSFYDGGKYKKEAEVFAQTEKMLAEGATFIDLGGYSSRPGAEEISEADELNRILPIVEKLISRFPKIVLSIDTFRSRVAKESVLAGAAMVNDISAGNLDANMLPTIAELQVPYCMMHMRGTPKTMQNLTNYENLIVDIMFYFSGKIEEAKNLGINDLIIDPGFGFSKLPAQGFEILKQLELFTNLELPILVGLSRKSMIYKTLETNAANALNGTSILHTIALQNGANILRAHDVKEAMECIHILEFIGDR
ncbi:MAG TPA: dihydropteroate synthase [Flavobacteriaceae bacterium]|nr:dihydropteroate synthase [Flavobacteriaceae bacterium]